MKKQVSKASCLTLAAVMALSTVNVQVFAEDSVYSDIQDHWSKPIVTKWHKAGVVKGYPDGTFKPDNMITRAEFATWIAQLSGYDLTQGQLANTAFTDVNNHWSVNTVKTLVLKGVIDEREYGTTYGPNQPITRMEMIRMMVRALQQEELANQSKGYTNFKDDVIILKNDSGFINVARDKGIVSGYPDGTLKPYGLATRAEGAAMLTKFQEVFEKEKPSEKPVKEPEKEPEKEPVKKPAKKPSKKPSSGGGGGGSSNRPSKPDKPVEPEKPEEPEKPDEPEMQKPTVEFTLPDKVYVGSTLDVRAAVMYATDVEWTIDVDGMEVDTSNFDEEGGSITIDTEGTYTFRAEVSNSVGSDSCERSVEAVPVANIGLSVPEYGHVGEDFDVTALLEDIGEDAEVIWSAYYEGSDIELPDGFDRFGGTACFDEPGKYTFVISYTDELGNVYEDEKTIRVLPMISLEITATPEDTYVDIAADISSNIDHLDVTWTLYKDGEAVEWDSVTDSVLDNNGGELLIQTAGEYTIQATVTDESGRVFKSNIETLTVLGIIEPVIKAPETTWVDRSSKIYLRGYTGDNVVWEVFDQEGNPYAYIGDLTPEGGEILIEDEGDYVIQATVVDDTGREYVVTANITVLPTANYNLTVDKEVIHVDDSIILNLIEPLTISDYDLQWFALVDGEEHDGVVFDDLSSVVLDVAGDYEIYAVMTDASGREFTTNSVFVSVLPYAEIELSVNQDTLYAQEPFEVITDLTEGADGEVTYTLSNGQEETIVELDEDGELTIDAAGEYTLTATYVDALGYEVSASIPLVIVEPFSMDISVPETVHVGEYASVDLDISGYNGDDILWEVMSEDGETVDNDLDITGGFLTFDKSGTYFITATVVDDNGEEHVATAEINVWDNVQLSFRLPEFAHTDESVVLKMTSENLGDSQVEWSLTVDGRPVAKGAEGALDNEGGSVRFSHVGTNVLTATVIDETGKEFTYSQTIEIYPVIELDVDTVKATHVDEGFDVGLTCSEDGYEVEWKVTHANDASAEVDYNGALADDGGFIMIEQAGIYSIVASVTDETGRVFKSPAAKVKIYPVAGLNFTLPATAYTDTHTPVDILSTDLVDIPVVWTLYKDGQEVPMKTFMYGELGDEGGTVRFPNTGHYELVATAVDDLGREYECRQEIDVYPVIEIAVDVDEIGYTDTPTDISAVVENNEGYPVTWTMYLNGVEKNPVDGLDDDGGHLNLDEPGLYTFVATVTDELGRVFSASDSVQVYPVGVAMFYIPSMFHTDEEVTIVTDFEELGENALRWTLTRNGEPVSVNDYFSNAPSDGGTDTFVSKEGDYVLKATFVDGGGRVYSHIQEFTVYPIPDVSWTLPNYAHTDTVIDVAVDAVDVLGVEGTSIKWFIDDTYGLRQNWDTYVDGTLMDSDGSIRIKHAGIYTLGCEVTDATGRVFTFDGPSIEVLPELKVGVEITEEKVYTGEDVQVRTLGNNIEIPVIWKLLRDGKPVDIDTYVTGELNNYGGSIQFTQGGTYELVGVLTDALGRSFESSDTIVVMPIGDLDFSMSEMEYVGNTVTIVMDKLDNPTGEDVVWSVRKDNALVNVDLSNMNNDGGTIVFPEVGKYTVEAAITDENGKTVKVEHSIDIVYRAQLTITAPNSVHIGKKFDVSLAGNGNLPVEWALKFGNKPVAFDSNTGFLDDIGGKLTLFEEGVYTLTAVVQDKAGNYQTGFVNITVTNNAPTITRFEANATRQVKDGRYYAELIAECEDPDGDNVTLEWDDNYQKDGWYEIGTHKIRVRAVDEWGATSAWMTKTIEFINSAPIIDNITATPSYTRNGNKFFCDIKVQASDPDGDNFTLEWDPNYSEDGYYSVGEHTVSVRAVDEYGAASAWQSKSFNIVERINLDVSATASVKPNENINVQATQAYTSYPVTWEVKSENGNVVNVSGLGNNGGIIKLQQPGNYTIKGSITGLAGNIVSDTATVKVVNNSVFKGKFSMNLYWPSNGYDMDSHMYFYNSSGSEVGHLYFSDKNVCGCSLDRDDTKGGVGEWLTVDFDAVPANVYKIDVSIYGYRGSADSTMILRQEKIITDGMGNTHTQIIEPVRLSTHVGNHETVSFGYFQRAGDSWDFYGYDGTIVHGSGQA